MNYFVSWALYEQTERTAAGRAPSIVSDAAGVISRICRSIATGALRMSRQSSFRRTET